jgi:hypothetical protein
VEAQNSEGRPGFQSRNSCPGHANCCAVREMKDERVRYLLQTAVVMAILMMALAAALLYLAPAA